MPSPRRVIFMHTAEQCLLMHETKMNFHGNKGDKESSVVLLPAVKVPPLLSFSTRPQNLLARSLVRHQRNVISIRSRAYSWPEYVYVCMPPRATFIYNCIPGYKCTRPSLINLINE
jgi:hypothetical protein